MLASMEQSKESPMANIARYNPIDEPLNLVLAKKAGAQARRLSVS